MNLIAGGNAVVCSFICFSFQLDVNQEIGRKIADEVAGLYTDKWRSSTIESEYISEFRF